MDWLSLFFFLLVGASLVYTGLAVMWGIRYFMGTHVDRAWVTINLPPLLYLTEVCWLVVALMFMGDYLGYFTIWELGYALAR